MKILLSIFITIISFESVAQLIVEPKLYKALISYDYKYLMKDFISNDTSGFEADFVYSTSRTNYFYFQNIDTDSNLIGEGYFHFHVPVENAKEYSKINFHEILELNEGTFRIHTLSFQSYGSYTLSQSFISTCHYYSRPSPDDYRLEDEFGTTTKFNSEDIRNNNRRE